MLWPADEAEENLLIQESGWRIALLQPEFITQFSNLMEKDVIQILDKFARLL